MPEKEQHLRFAGKDTAAPGKEGGCSSFTGRCGRHLGRWGPGIPRPVECSVSEWSQLEFKAS